MSQKVVIVGGGHAAGQVIATLRQKKFSGSIVLVGEELYLPYQRPPLSKKYLAGKLDAERLHFKAASFYDAPGIEVRLGQRVTQIDRERSEISCNDGQRIAYDRLVLATGSRPRRLMVDGETLEGVHYLRGIDDVDRIRKDIAARKKAVIVGAGYIGLEVAAVCSELGVVVTVIEMADRVMSRVVSPEVSQFYQRYHERQGVEFRLSTGLRAFRGDRRVAAVETDDGNAIDADFVIIGAGIVPNVELAEAADLEINNGIVVDDHCRSSDTNIFAVGDCTMHPNSIYGRSIRLESVHNALEQAKTAARNICGDDVAYSEVPWFWSDQYDLKLQIAGISAGYDATVQRGNPQEGRFSCLYLRDGVLLAIDAINSPRDFMQAKSLIARRSRIDPAALAKSDVELKALG